MKDAQSYVIFVKHPASILQETGPCLYVLYWHMAPNDQGFDYINCHVVLQKMGSFGST